MLLPPLVGNDVSLLPFLKEHVTDAYLGWLNDPEVTRFTEIRCGRETKDSVRAYVKTTIQDPSAAIWRILTDKNVHVGDIRLSNIKWAHRRSEVAILLGSRRHWGQGIAAGAIELVSRYAFDALQLRKLSAGIYVNHLASRRALRCANRPAGPCGATGRPRRELRSSMASLRRSYRLRGSGGDPGKGDA